MISNYNSSGSKGIDPNAPFNVTQIKSSKYDSGHRKTHSMNNEILNIQVPQPKRKISQ